MKVVTFGELMVRLQPYNYERFVQASTLEFTFGGGEANVAVSLANYGADAVFVTSCPPHAIGQCAINSLRVRRRHHQDRARRRPCRHLLQREGRLAARLGVHL